MMDIKSSCIKLVSEKYCNGLFSFKTEMILICIILAFVGFIIFFNKIKSFFLKNEKKVFLAIIGLFVIINLIYQFTQGATGDLLEHTHSGFLVSQGQIIYVDFLQMHHPLYYLLISPTFLIFQNMTAIYLLYFLSFAALIASCVYLYKIGMNLFNNKRISYLIVIFFVSIKNVLVSYELRPDPFSALFLIISFHYLIKAKDIKSYIKSGLCMGISVFFMQKTILYFAAFLFTIFINNILRKSQIIKNIKNSFYFSIFGILPTAIYVFFVYLIEGIRGINTYYLSTYVLQMEENWGYDLVNRFTAYSLTNGIHFILAIVGIFIFVKYYKKIENYGTLVAIMILNLVIFSYFIIEKVIGAQYFLYLAPFFAISGTLAFIHLGKKIPKKVQSIWYALSIIILLIIPLTFTYLNATTINHSDNKEIKFYLNNFKGELANCNFIFNRGIELWHPTDSRINYFYAEQGIKNKTTDDLINENYRIICVNQKDKISQQKLIENNYVRYNTENGYYQDMFYKPKENQTIKVK